MALYKIKEETPSMVAETVVAYGAVRAQRTFSPGESSCLSPLPGCPENKKATDYRAEIEHFLSEADELYGDEELMSVDDYFGKLRYVVNACYDNLRSQGLTDSQEGYPSQPICRHSRHSSNGPAYGVA